ncbi:hypothetical protein K466DRAFT_594972 [Polyporus arcularius HHB13444]|uniref:Uncharacterized protein n=1 Tax=Polyporus arcularius HHB13444 TaxID=1314778 RepID=A0A5C3PVI1_9APHY|nr:hypothetical protein K466DRAFT_594972 [Polyporus arcularius HHB13444]
MSGQRMNFHGDHGIVSVLSNTASRINIPICVSATDFAHATQLPPATNFDRRMGARVSVALSPLLEALIPVEGASDEGPVSDAVAAGARPSTSTVVDVYLPPMTHEDMRYFEGMLNLEFRYNTMRCFEVFGKLISQDVYGLLFDSEAYKTMHRLTEDET